STPGARPSTSVQSLGSSETWTQRPSRVMPSAITSKRSRSIAARTPPAVTHEMPCSPLRPPNRRATVVLMPRGYSFGAHRAGQQGRGDLIDALAVVDDGHDGPGDRHVHAEACRVLRDGAG